MDKNEASSHFLKLNGISKKLHQLKYSTLGTAVNEDVKQAITSIEAALEKLTLIIEGE